MKQSWDCSPNIQNDLNPSITIKKKQIWVWCLTCPAYLTNNVKTCENNYKELHAALQLYYSTGCFRQATAVRISQHHGWQLSVRTQTKWNCFSYSHSRSAKESCCKNCLLGEKGADIIFLSYSAPGSTGRATYSSCTLLLHGESRWLAYPQDGCAQCISLGPSPWWWKRLILFAQRSFHVFTKCMQTKLT